MVNTTLISLYERETTDSRLLDLQSELVDRFLPEFIVYKQMEMATVFQELPPPFWHGGTEVNDSSDYHGSCLDRCIYNLPYDHFLFLDIDAVPLSPSFFEVMLALPHGLAGAAQAANHVSDDLKRIAYISPAALSVSKQTYTALQTSFRPRRNGDGERIDTGAWFSRAAEKAGLPIVSMYPTDTLQPHWSVGHHDYGFITAYGSHLCHMWASRALSTLIYGFFEEYVRLQLETSSFGCEASRTRLNENSTEAGASRNLTREPARHTEETRQIVIH